ncbi:MAG: hypothetical protein IT334_00565 [Thermomicrobiales bacterium]|nr:hypothetical protein [Thermomicrobiales bacterium]
MTIDTDIHSSLLPGGNFITALFNRQLMSFADRGGASGLVGDRWSDICNDTVQAWVGGVSDVPGGRRPAIEIERIARLDAVPAIAAAASKRGLQNPDFIIIGTQAGRPAIQAADAKFSIETARSRQVSVEVLDALLVLRPQLAPLTGEIDPEAVIEPGFFVSPDYPMTHQMLRRQRNGVRRATVQDDEVEQILVGADEFFSSIEGAELLPLLGRTDGLPIPLESSLLASLYYFRIARALIGCWVESVKPLLYMGDRTEIDLEQVMEEAVERAGRASSAYQLMIEWDADVERFRSARAAVDQVTHLPIVNRDLREMVTKLSDDLGIEAPSLNQVRRRLGSWFRGEIRDEVGPLNPPIADLTPVLQQLAQVSSRLTPHLPEEIHRIVTELGLEQIEAAESVEIVTG